MSASEADIEMGNCFFDLVGLLSSIRSVLNIRSHPATESQLLHLALFALVENLHIQNCSIFLKKDEGLTCAAGAGFAELVANRATEDEPDAVKSQRGNLFQPGEGLIGLAYQSEAIQYSGDCENDPRFVEIKGLAKLEQQGSLVSLPMIDGNRVLGVLNVFHSEKDFFDSWQQTALSLFADAVTQLLVNYRLIRDLDHKVAARTAALERALGQSNKIREQFEKMSMTDELTGLMNRRSFFRSAKPLLSRAMRTDAKLAMALIDLDWFKKVNDDWGHVFGDQVLQRVAAVLSAELRDADILARLGGEEFVLLLPDTDPDGATHLVERIRDSLLDIDSTANDSDVGITASYGLTFLDESYRGQDPIDVLEALYEKADAAMYQSKAKGRDTWTIAESETN